MKERLSKYLITMHYNHKTHARTPRKEKATYLAGMFIKNYTLS